MSKTNQKGMSGISTLIIFIALILVAAVAALVLLQTVGSLQSQALATGKQSKEQVSTNLQIKSVHGYVPGNNSIVFLRIVMQLAPGSGKVNLDKTYIAYTDGTTFKTGVDYNMTGANDNNELGAMTYALITFDSDGTYNGSTTAADVYSIRWLGELSTYSDKTDIDPQDTVEIFYRTGTIAINTNIEVSIAPPEGTPVEVYFRTPSSFDSNYVILFP